ncbi:MAG: hypothetical protein AAFR56_06435 [Chloroflexota bacterium]
MSNDNSSPFLDDWRESLREHYKDVVRRNDTQTEKTLVGVLHDVGFTDDDLRQLKLEATMRAEDLHGDFVPDLDLYDDDHHHHSHDDHHHHHHIHDDDDHHHSHDDHHHVEEEGGRIYAGVAIEPADEEDLPAVDEADIAAGEPLTKDESVVAAGADGNIAVYEKTEADARETDGADEPDTGDTEPVEEPPEEDADAPTQMSMF